MTGCHCLGVTLRVTAERGRRDPSEAGHPLTLDAEKDFSLNIHLATGADLHELAVTTKSVYLNKLP